MKLQIDTEKKTLSSESKTLDLYSKEAFELLSQHWVEVGWCLKHIYTFTWMGRPIIQLPEDLLRVQEVIYQLKPDVIIETGIAHGGSLIFYASLCKAMGKGRIVGIDIEIRPHNRAAIEAHELFPYLTLIEGDAVAPATVDRVKRLVKPDETVLILLDSNHSKSHVIKELEAYHSLVSVGSYIVATDGIMQQLHDKPRAQKEWLHDNPQTAVAEFLQHHPNFSLSPPPWRFNESPLSESITHWPNSWLKRNTL